MLIQQYGLFLQVTLNNGTTIEQNISSFKDIPLIRIENIKLCNILSNSKMNWGLKENIVTLYNSPKALSPSNTKVLPGWQLAYLIKRTRPDIFSSRSVT